MNDTTHPDHVPTAAVTTEEKLAEAVAALRRKDELASDLDHQLDRARQRIEGLEAQLKEACKNLRPPGQPDPMQEQYKRDIEILDRKLHAMRGDLFRSHQKVRRLKRERRQLLRHVGQVLKAMVRA